MKYLFRLHFRNGVHFGSDEAGFGKEEVQGIAHSDTLFSALVNTLASVRHHFAERSWVEPLIRKSDSEGLIKVPFKLSSFGFVHQNEKPTYYLPKPLGMPTKLISSEDMEKWGKEFKRRQFISLATFKKWQQGQILNLEKIIKKEQESFWTTDVRIQHLTDNQTLATQIYRTGVIFYHENISPFFILDLDEEWMDIQEFVSLLELLKYTGLGGRRTAGCGSFDFSDEDWFCLDNTNDNDSDEIRKTKSDFRELFGYQSNSRYLFSLFYPQDFTSSNPIAYDLVQRKGWVYSSSSFEQLKRKTCFMFAEGSIFSQISDGRLVDVTPKEFAEHRVYRFGVPFTIPFGEAMS